MIGKERTCRRFVHSTQLRRRRLRVFFSLFALSGLVIAKELQNFKGDQGGERLVQGTLSSYSFKAGYNMTSTFRVRRLCQLDVPKMTILVQGPEVRITQHDMGYQKSTYLRGRPVIN